MSDTRELYEAYHRECPFPDFGNDTFHGEKAIAAYSDAKEILDFGCGNGTAVRKMRAANQVWFGLEYSQTAYDKYLREPYFYVGDTTQFPSQRFDMVYSTEVLEHITPEAVEKVVADLCRVTARYQFLTISLRPSSADNKYHCTLRPRAWWEALFARYDFLADRAVVERFQPVTLKSTKQILSKWSTLGPTCRAFAEHPPYELHGETQFWFFAFRRRGVPAPALPKPTQPYLRRTLVPYLRRLIYRDAA